MRRLPPRLGSTTLGQTSARQRRRRGIQIQSIGRSPYCRVAIEAIRNDLAHSVVRINCFAAARPRIGRGDPVAFSLCGLRRSKEQPIIPNNMVAMAIESKSLACLCLRRRFCIHY